MLARLRHLYEGARKKGGGLDGDTILVSLVTMITDITSKTLHEKTGQVLTRAALSTCAAPKNQILIS